MSIDLEIDPKTNRIQSLTGVLPGMAAPCVFKRGNLGDALETLDRFSDPADFLLGHNFITFDAHHLEAARADLRLHRKSIIDTLWLNPLAFPRNPYHHLVKHYQDGRLQAGHVNDPELDAELVLTVLANQIDALSEIDKADPEDGRWPIRAPNLRFAASLGVRRGRSIIRFASGRGGGRFGRLLLLVADETLADRE